MVAGGLALAALGLVILTQVRVDHGLVELVVASVVISLGMGPVFGLTTEMIVGLRRRRRPARLRVSPRPPPSSAGRWGSRCWAASAWRSTAAGSPTGLPAGLPPEAAQVARDTLGGAVGVAEALPGDTATALLDAARAAFVTGLQLTSAIAAGIAAVMAVVAAVALRESGPPAADETDQTDDDEATPALCAC